ncbi:NUDIX domain-containing protein [Halomonas organivorans]
MGHDIRPVVAVAAAVVRDGRLLLVRRGRPPKAGRLALPGGKVGPGETLEAAVRRELREETGLEGAPLALLEALDLMDHEGPDARLRSHYVLLVYRVAVQEGEARAGDDAESLHWLDLAGLEAAGEDVTDTTLAVARRLLSPSVPKKGR